MTFKTNSAERMRIDSSGNVGIGDSSPSSLGTNITTLEIKGAATTRSGGIRLSTSDDSQKAAFYVYDGAGIVGTETAHPFGIYTSNTERLRIDSSGNVGIGTTSADANLHIKGGYPTVHIERDSDINYSRLLLDNTANDGGAIDGLGDGVGGLRFSTSDAGTITERVRIDSSGNVGIGTSSPGSKFVVSNGGAAGIEFGPLNGDIFTYDRTALAYTDMLFTSNEFVVRTNGSNERLRVDNGLSEMFKSLALLVIRL